MSKNNNTPLITIITCTYNRSNTLPKVYASLLEQTYKNFEWIVSDDGSTDETNILVQNWIEEKKISIVYLYQENNGKHIASNMAIEVAQGDYIVNIDSDDVMRNNALEVFVNAWNNVSPELYGNIMSIKARCFNPNTGVPIGKNIPHGYLVTNFLDAKYKYHIQDEMWSMVKTSVAKEYPNPNIRGGYMNGGLRFYPEGIAQDLAARKYNIILIDDALRGYARDSSNSLMGRGVKYNRSRENIYLWTHIVNNNLDYFWYDPKSFVKAFVGVSMDCFFLKKSFEDMMKMVKGVMRKVVVFGFIPVGYMCYLMKK